MVESDINLDFKSLAELHPPLQQYLNSSNSVDWLNDEAVFELTRATLFVNCHLTVYNLPNKNLMPRIPQRLAYL